MTSDGSVILPEIQLAILGIGCKCNYVTRSTHDVVDDQDLGRYSDPPLPVLVSLADGAKRGHGTLEDAFRMSSK